MLKSFLSGLATRLAGEPIAANEMPSAEQFVLRGVHVAVVNTRPDITTATVVERLDEALGLIEQYQPWRLRHLQRDLRGIRVERFACRGAFIPDQQVCITELTFLARRDITAAPVASSILHEGVHARVHAMGVSPINRDRAREERLCRRAELAFGQSLPPELGAPVIERAWESLQLEDNDVAPTIDWTEAQRRQNALDQSALQ
ncbi:MAG: hypothetical protein M3Y64_01710 [Gemmatimonadota bacterium]|nr:hypothetical protein [Gemmatimonadota bacterium]